MGVPTGTVIPALGNSGTEGLELGHVAAPAADQTGASFVNHVFLYERRAKKNFTS
jgi:hypothetical protein